MINDIHSTTKDAMQKAIDSLKKDYQTLRTGKISSKILDGIMVDYYGSMMAVNALASITVSDANTIIVVPWEKKILKDLDHAIASANIGVTPNNNGESLILSFAPMTVEQRQIIAKQAKSMTEGTKVSVRKARQDANNKLSKLEKDKEISEDESKKAQSDIQKLTDDFIKLVDETFKTKEAEILKV